MTKKPDSYIQPDDQTSFARKNPDEKTDAELPPSLHEHTATLGGAQQQDDSGANQFNNAGHTGRDKRSAAPNPLQENSTEALERWLKKLTLLKQDQADGDDTQDQVEKGAHEEEKEDTAAAPQQGDYELDESSGMKGLAETTEANPQEQHVLREKDQDEPMNADDETTSADDGDNKDEDTPMDASTLQQQVEKMERGAETMEDCNEGPPSEISEDDASADGEKGEEVPDLSELLRQKLERDLDASLTAPSSSSEQHPLVLHGATTTPSTRMETQDDLGPTETEQLTTPKHWISESKARDIWNQYELQTAGVASALCEQLRMILDPTLRGRLHGDFKTGKRLSMRKVVAFIASNFRRDRIWLRRCKPHQRDYRIVVALDNSKSMSECDAGPRALQAVCAVCRAFQKLEIGKTGVCSFGGAQPEVILPLNDHAFSDEIGAKIVSAFTFTEESATSHDQAVPQLLDLATQLFSEDAAAAASSAACPVRQMLLILSDGRFNKQTVRRKVHAALAEGITPVLLIIDSTETPPASSATAKLTGTDASRTHRESNKRPCLLQMKEAAWVDGKLVVSQYLDDFPFPFYAILNNVSEIPDVVGDVIRQWIEMLTRQ